jgi:hypothetical protein
MKTEDARRLMEHCLSAGDELLAALREAEGKCSATELKNLKSVILELTSGILVDVINPLWAEHPQAAPSALRNSAAPDRVPKVERLFSQEWPKED